jgi:hypothetical protein
MATLLYCKTTRAMTSRSACAVASASACSIAAMVVGPLCAPPPVSRAGRRTTFSTNVRGGLSVFFFVFFVHLQHHVANPDVTDTRSVQREGLCRLRLRRRNSDLCADPRADPRADPCCCCCQEGSAQPRNTSFSSKQRGQGRGGCVPVRSGGHADCTRARRDAAAHHEQAGRAHPCAGPRSRRGIRSPTS